MEVVPLTVPRRSDPTVTVGIPFSKRNVEEWSRLDRLTGMMETAKIETDHWSARSTNAAHKYDKMVDSRERNNKDGTIHESQRKQMEVFQTQIPGGSMQVIRTQTVTTSSKSSKWTSTNDKVFSDLQLPINSLDLSSQKTKGSVGRSGSIGGRRPPSRPRSLIGQSSSMFGEESSISKLCHQIHEKAKSEMFKSFPGADMRVNGFGKEPERASSPLVITDVTESCGNSQSNNLYRRKSCSNENVANETSDGEDALKRSSKVRRSLQFPKPLPDSEELEWTGGKSLKERAAEIENLLKRGCSSTIMYRNGTRNQNGEADREKSKIVRRRDSFVSADTLKEVREKLKKSSLNDSDMKDDGIVTERDETNQSRVKCFVHGMEAINAKATVNGTGSLESRSSCRNSLNGSRNSEWYRRRKSYGFEGVDESDKFGKFHRKSNIESSTDSGICQSSETIGVPAWSKTNSAKGDAFRLSPVSTVVTVGVRPDSQQYQPLTSKLNEKSVHSVYLDNPTCSVRVEEPKASHWKYNAEPYGSTSPWTRKSPISIPRNNEIRETLKSSLCSAKNPWISQLKGTKLVDRDWTADEQESGEGKEEPKSTLLKKETEAGVETTLKKNKKVEFCKTEVHFAAESGKFNIVETDAKPPPNDIFKRRRRHLLPPIQKNLNGLPETKFGDSTYEKKLLTSESISDKIEAELKELSQLVIDSLPEKEENTLEYKKPTEALYDVLEEDTEEAKGDCPWPRSILKSNVPTFLTKRAGNDGVRAGGSPIPPAPQVWKSTVILRNKRYDNVRKNHRDDAKLYSSDGENELQVRIRNLRKTDPKWLEQEPTARMDVKRLSLPDDVLLKQTNESSGRISSEEMPSLSVAERVKKVEELKSSTNYSSKINFRSGEMTVVQNGREGEVGAKEEEKKRLWTQRKAPENVISSKDTATISCDNKVASNPPVMRFSTNKDDKTDPQKYQTTRILINFQSSSQSESQTPQTTTTPTALGKLKPNNINKTQARPVSSYGSWSPGMKKDLNRYFNDLKSATLVRETIRSTPEDRGAHEDMPKPSKTVHEIIDQFDSLSSPKRNIKDRRRKTMPVNYKAPKEYTQADLEEELKNFTENLDKDFRDIYEEEIGSMKKKSQNKEEKTVQSMPQDNLRKGCGSLSSTLSKTSFQKTSPRLNYDSDDSDLLADEEVRSYMSAGQGGTDSDAEEAYGSCGSKKSFEDSVHRFKQLEVRKKKEIINEIRPTHASYVKPEKLQQRKIASISLKYEDDPHFSTTNFKTSPEQAKAPKVNGFKEENDRWEKTSNSSSTNSNKRERNSYLNVLSLSEKYSRYLERSSNSSLDNIQEYKTDSRRSKNVDCRSETEHRRVGLRYGGSADRSDETASKNQTVNADDKKVSRNLTKRYGTQVENERTRQRVALSRNANLADRTRLMQNLDRRKLAEKQESVILKELTRAADEILVAVNDYDDDSHPASSEDDDRPRSLARRSKPGNLGTISEGKRVTKTEAMKSTMSSSTKRHVGTQSSASSLESLSRASPRRETRPRQSETSKPLSSRATRLLQRANIRQASMPQPSSSEDLPSYVELARKRSLRRQRSSASVKSSDVGGESKGSKTKPRTRTTETSSVPRTRDKRSEKSKELTSASRSVKSCPRSSRVPEMERPKSSGRRTGAEKLVLSEESTKRKRIHHSSANQDSAASTALQRKKPLEKWKP